MNIIITIHKRSGRVWCRDDGLSPAIASRTNGPDFSATTAYLPKPDIVLDKWAKNSIYDSPWLTTRYDRSEKLTGGAKRHCHGFLIQGKLERKFIRCWRATDEFKWDYIYWERIESGGCMGSAGWKPFGMRKTAHPATQHCRNDLSLILILNAQTTALMTKHLKRDMGRKEGTTRFSQPTEVGRHTAAVASVFGM